MVVVARLFMVVESYAGIYPEFNLLFKYFFATVLPYPTFNLYGTPVISDISYFTLNNLIAYHTQSTHSILIYFSVICLIYIICFQIIHANSVICFSFYVQ
jgi:hypothetical protein